MATRPCALAALNLLKALELGLGQRIKLAHVGRRQLCGLAGEIGIKVGRVHLRSNL